MRCIGITFFFVILMTVNLSAGEDSLKVVEVEIELKNPSTALAISAVFPGGGQYYAESYFHGTAFVAVNGYLLYMIFSKNAEFNDLNSQLEQNPDDEDLQNSIVNARDSRNLHIWLWSFSYLLNLMDAYTEATLYNFDKRMELKVQGNIYPIHGEMVPVVAIQLEF